MTESFAIATSPISANAVAQLERDIADGTLPPAALRIGAGNGTVCSAVFSPDAMAKNFTTHSDFIPKNEVQALVQQYREELAALVGGPNGNESGPVAFHLKADHAHTLQSALSALSTPLNTVGGLLLQRYASEGRFTKAVLSIAKNHVASFDPAALKAALKADGIAEKEAAALAASLSKDVARIAGVSPTKAGQKFAFLLTEDDAKKLSAILNSDPHLGSALLRYGIEKETRGKTQIA